MHTVVSAAFPRRSGSYTKIFVRNLNSVQKQLNDEVMANNTGMKIELNLHAYCLYVGIVVVWSVLNTSQTTFAAICD